MSARQHLLSSSGNSSTSYRPPPTGYMATWDLLCSARALGESQHATCWIYRNIRSYSLQGRVGVFPAGIIPKHGRAFNALVPGIKCPNCISSSVVLHKQEMSIMCAEGCVIRRRGMLRASELLSSRVSNSIVRTVDTCLGEPQARNANNWSCLCDLCKGTKGT